MNDIVFAKIRKARMEVEKEIISENMMGIDFTALLCECRTALQIMCTSEEFGGHEMQFKKGEW
jgi:hypothetical protein